MRLHFDENLSPHLLELLRDLYADTVHVRDVGLASADDDAVWQFAAIHGYMVVTKDADFNQRAFLIGPPPKVIWLRMGNASTAEIAQLLRQHHADINIFLQDTEAALLAIQ